MPVERVSKSFKDISLTFQTNPLNDDILATKNETAIARSIRNLILTNRGERFFRPNLGSSIPDSLFENMDFTTVEFIKDNIELTINNYEPRVDLIEVNVNPNFDQNQYDVIIKYNIVGIDVLPQQLSFALQPTR